MAKMIQTGWVVVVLLCSQVACADSMHFSLPPHVSKSVDNTYAWTINAQCTVQSKGAKSSLKVHMVHNNGAVNGRSLAEGHDACLSLSAHDTVMVSADSGASVRLINLSNQTVEATCSA